MKTLFVILSLVIRISTQGDFDSMGQNLIGKILSGEKDISVQILPGVYAFRENHLDLSQVNEPDVSITISGDGATIRAEGGIPQALDPKIGYISLSGGNVDPWGPFYSLRRQVDILSKDTKECRIRWDETDFVPDKGTCPRYVRITRWYLSSVYKVTRMDDKYLYFIADDLDKSFYLGWNVNDDYHYGGSFPRFSVLPAGVPDIPDLRECRATRFLRLWYGTHLKSVTLSGLRFLGNARDGLTGLLDFMSPECECLVKDCRFEGMRSARVISVGNTNSVSIEECVFNDIYEDGVNASHSSVGTRVYRCRFERCGLGMVNSFCTTGSGTDFHVAYNTFLDFGYSAIGLGYGYLNEHKHEISAIAEHNQLTYSTEWAAHPEQHCLMDSGAIYVSTQNDRTIIRNNQILSYTGMKGNRGIFCDDGAYNLQIYGNTILGINNDYSIDSWRCKRVERDPASKVQRTNYNIRIYDNVVNAPILFEPRDEEPNGCYLGDNPFRQGAEKPSLLDRIKAFFSN